MNPIFNIENPLDDKIFFNDKKKLKLMIKITSNLLQK